MPIYLAIISETYKQLQDMINEVTGEFEKVGLKMNNKLMNNIEDHVNVTIDNTIEQAAEIRRRVRLEWTTFGKLTYSLRNKNYPQHLRNSVFDGVLPVSTYVQCTNMGT